MAFTLISANRFTTSHSFVFSAADDDATVMAGVSVGSSNGVGLYASSSAHDLTVLGQVAGYQAGIRLGNSAPDANNRLVIGENGVVFGALVGVAVFGQGARVYNLGDIYGNDIGIQITATGGTTVVRNGFDALITARTGVQIDPASTGLTRFYNDGALLGGDVAFRGSDAVEQFWNDGDVQGDILLGGGNDRFEGYAYSPDPMLIDGGAGNDAFILRSYYGEGNQAVLDGGTGFDTLDLRPSGGVRGLRLGEDVLRFERVIGGQYYDEITGDGFANTIEGREGDDLLDGGGGADTIIGGPGQDFMTGGIGNDSFRFNGPQDAPESTFYRDRITDWNDVLGDDDRLMIDASGFGGGLPLGTLDPIRFQSRVDNVAQDGDDRFIFETDVRILWFDIDGNGAAAPVAIADFGGTAPVTAADIFVVA